MSARLLVVDDNAINRKLVMHSASRLGWDVSEVDCGDAALELVHRERIAVVLLDINMPGMSGEEVLAHMLAMQERRPARIIAYTAHAMPDEKARFLELGFDDLLIKPVSLSRLGEVLGHPRE